MGPQYGAIPINVILINSSNNRKKAIRHIHNPRYRDHTNDYFIKSNILGVQELMEYTSLCYIQMGLQDYAPEQVRHLWAKIDNNNFILRDKTMKIDAPFTTKDWIARLEPM